MKIQIIDSILCKSDRGLAPYIAPCLEHQKSFWKQGQFRKIQKTYMASFINKRTGVFLSGLLPKVVKFLNDKNVPFEIEGEFERIAFGKSPKLPDITLRPDQENLVRKAYEKQRGIILSPTGSGKTVIAAGFMSMFPKLRILFLCHSLDIIDQTYKELEKFEFKNVAVLGGGRKDWNQARIVISTIQTFVKFDPKIYCDCFDIVIADEAHHVADRKGQYGQVLQNLLAPVKIGFTATLPTGKEKLLSLEGLLGPVIGEVSIQEGVDLGIIAKPEIVLVPVPERKIDSYKYRDIYRELIVENRIRNKLIIQIAKKIIEAKETVLIMVKEIVHGELIQNLAYDLFDIDIKFVQGATEAENRIQLKECLEKGETKAVVCTSVWREGINIKPLQNIIIAIGGKSDVLVLQSIGRGLRKTKSKNTIRVYDFIDIGKYISEHFAKRLQIYINLGWIITNYKFNS